MFDDFEIPTFKTGIDSLASNNSFWRGYDYAKMGRASLIQHLEDNVYLINVEGSQDEPYKVVLDMDHLRKSTCTCPYCEGHERRFCKHKVAAYFLLNPKEFEDVDNHVMAQEAYNEMRYEQAEKAREIKLKEVSKEVDMELSKLSSEEIKQQLRNYLINEKMGYFDDDFGEDEDEYDWY